MQKRLEYKSNLWSTEEFILASSLVYLGFVVEACDSSDSRRIKFFFTNSQELLQQVERFWRGELAVEPRSFHHAERDLKARIRSLSTQTCGALK